MDIQDNNCKEVEQQEMFLVDEEGESLPVLMLSSDDILDNWDTPMEVVPYVFLIERSSLLSLKAISQARMMIEEFCKALNSSERIFEICVISFASDVSVDVDWCESANVEIPDYHSSSDEVALESAIKLALDKLEKKVEEYARSSKHLCEPHMYVLGTGNSSDPSGEQDIAEEVRQKIDNGELAFYAIGCGKVDVEQFCKYYSLKEPRKAVFPSITSARNTIGFGKRWTDLCLGNKR